MATGAAADSPAASFRVRAARHLMGKRVRMLLQPQGHQGHHAECPGFEVQNQIYQISHFKFKMWSAAIARSGNSLGGKKKINSFLSKWCPGSTTTGSMKMISQTESDEPEAVKLDNVIGFNIKGHSIPGPIISISGDTGPSKFFNHLLIFKKEKVELDHCPGVSPN